MINRGLERLGVWGKLKGSVAETFFLGGDRFFGGNWGFGETGRFEGIRGLDIAGLRETGGLGNWSIMGKLRLGELGVCRNWVVMESKTVLKGCMRITWVSGNWGFWG